MLYEVITKRNQQRGIPMSHHGMTTPRGLCHRGPGAPMDGRFGVLFPGLPRMIIDPDDLREAGKLGGAMDEGVHGKIGQTTTPLGYVFLGQFSYNFV